MGQGEVKGIQFDRHRVRKEVVSTNRRVIIDKDLWKQLKGSQDETAKAVILGSDRQTVTFDYGAAGLGLIPQEAVDAHATVQYRPMTMSHMMVTYVLHKRAVGTTHNKQIMQQMGKAVDRLFTHHLHEMVVFGYTIDAKTKQLKKMYQKI